jgi:hypothetical protein
MTAVAYAMRDHAPDASADLAPGSLGVPVSRGGCGQAHTAVVDDHGYVRYECDKCAPALIGSHYGFSATPGGVPLTPDEISERDLARRDAEVSQNAILKGITEHFLATMSAGAKAQASPVAKTLVEQVGAMSETDRADLAKALQSLADSEQKDEPKGPARPRTPRGAH